MLAQGRWCEVRSKVKGERGKVESWSSCLSATLPRWYDNGSGVSVDQFAVATYKSHLSKNFEQNRSTLKFQLLIVNLLRLKSICLLRLFVIIVPTLIVIRSSARYVYWLWSRFSTNNFISFCNQIFNFMPFDAEVKLWRRRCKNLRDVAAFGSGAQHCYCRI